MIILWLVMWAIIIVGTFSIIHVFVGEGGLETRFWEFIGAFPLVLVAINITDYGKFLEAMFLINPPF